MAAPRNVVCLRGVVPARTCDHIVALGDALDLSGAATVSNADDAYARTARSGEVAFIPHEERYQFIFDGIHYLTSEANRTNWRFELVGLLPLQYSIYREGHHFDWHRDTLSAPPEVSRGGPPLVLKLSLSLQLSEPDAYEGGDFQARGDDGAVDAAYWSAMRARGSLIIFPSATEHRVVPVTGGERRSLVGWVLGVASAEDLAFDPRPLAAS